VPSDSDREREQREQTRVALISHALEMLAPHRGIEAVPPHHVLVVIPADLARQVGLPAGGIADLSVTICPRDEFAARFGGALAAGRADLARALRAPPGYTAVAAMDGVGVTIVVVEGGQIQCTAPGGAA